VDENLTNYWKLFVHFFKIVIAEISIITKL
jgi:hypothetical protein